MESHTFWALFFVAMTCSTLAVPRTTHAVSGDKLDDVTVGRDQGQRVGRSRQKRFVVEMALSIAGLVTGVVGTGVSIGSYADAKINDPHPEIKAKLDEIKSDLQQLSNNLDRNFREVQNVLESLQRSRQKGLLSIQQSLQSIQENMQSAHQILQSIQQSLESLRSNHEITRIAAIFGDDVLRLNYFKLFTDHEANYNANNQIIVDEESLAWAQAVLSQASDGIGPVLYSIHRMITGSFGTRPIVEVYMNDLRLSGNTNIVNETEKLVDTLNGMQDMGYSLWVIALDVTNRTDEVSAVRDLLEQRVEDQQDYLTVRERLPWPQGSYGLVQTAQGCPGGRWNTGSRYHDTENYRPRNNWSPSNLDRYINGSFGSSGITWGFCMNAETNSPVSDWPSGKYCIFAGSAQCPTGFSRGHILFDDEDNNNANRKSGYLPYGDFLMNSRYYFCCHTDGDENTEISLPLGHPFVLFPLHRYSCQRVKYMTATELSIFWDCEDDDTWVRRSWPYPTEEDQFSDMKIKMCYYE